MIMLGGLEPLVKPRWPLRDAVLVADALCDILRPACDRIIVAGSVRRLRPTVGDIEILYVPRLINRRRPGDFFAREDVPATDPIIHSMINSGRLARRRNAKGSEVFGPLNKLLMHCASGIPVDLFATTPDAWHNYLVCRTGPAASNIRIAQAATARGWMWNPYGAGFTRLSDGYIEPMLSEQAVFHFVGLPWLPPEERQ